MTTPQEPDELGRVLEALKEVWLHDPDGLSDQEAKSALNQLLAEAREEVHALYPDKEEYLAKPLVDQLLMKARRDELFSYFKFMEASRNRIAKELNTTVSETAYDIRLKQRIGELNKEIE